MFLDKCRTKWSNLWNVDAFNSTNRDISETHAGLRTVAQNQQADNPTILTGDSFRAAGKSYKKNSKGVGSWQIGELTSPPKVITDEIAQALAHASQTVASPYQHSICLNPMLGKPGGGERNICNTP